MSAVKAFGRESLVIFEHPAAGDTLLRSDESGFSRLLAGV